MYRNNPWVIPTDYFLANSSISLVYYYSDKENKYRRIPYQYNKQTPMMRGHCLKRRTKIMEKLTK